MSDDETILDIITDDDTERATQQARRRRRRSSQQYLDALRAAGFKVVRDDVAKLGQTVVQLELTATPGSPLDNFLTNLYNQAGVQRP